MTQSGTMTTEPLKITLNATGTTVAEHDLHEVLVVAQDEVMVAQVRGLKQHRSQFRSLPNTTCTNKQERVDSVDISTLWNIG